MSAEKRALQVYTSMLCHVMMFWPAKNYIYVGDPRRL